MRNLITLKEFLEDNFECMCFYNDVNDGYHNNGDNQNIKINTLSVFFLNKIDIESSKQDERIRKIINNKVCNDLEYISGFHGNMLFTELIHNEKTLFIMNSRSFLPLGGGLDLIIHYFIGIDINDKMFSFPLLHKELKFPKSQFCIPRDHNIKQYLEDYLQKNNKCLVEEKNGFFIQNNRLFGCSNFDNIENPSLLEQFSNEINSFHRIINQRKEIYGYTLQKFSSEDWKKYKEKIGIDLQVPQKSDIFND